MLEEGLISFLRRWADRRTTTQAAGEEDARG
jgi:hypothetical protein